jgi:phosphoglycolate phosphatase-like HAD superfamily hydrolase
MVQAVIFDIDGTIIDSVALHIQAWKRTFERFGKEVSDEQIRRQIGKGADDMLPLFFSSEELDRFRPDLEKYRGDLFKREYLPKLNAFPRVRELFERIKYDGRKIALGSTAKGEEINIYKEIARIEDLVDCAACSDEVQRSKPHSDICAVALDKLGDVLPDSVLAIGDTPYDIEAAGKINVRSIALLCGGGNREELQQAGSIAIYHHPADLLEHYDVSPLGSALIREAAVGNPVTFL